MKQFRTRIFIIALPGLVVLLSLFCLTTNPANAKARRIIRESSASSKYIPGKGTPIGTVRKVSGSVFILHEDLGTIFVAQKGYALYAGDTLTTKRSGRIAFVLKDDSEITLAPGTSMVLNDAVLDPVNKRRSALVNLVMGKARFLVKKFADFRYSTFNVRTRTAIAAVRGSDFIIEQVGDKTIITTLGKTVVEVTNPDFPLAEPVTVNSFQQLIVAIGELPGNPFNVTEEELRDRLDNLNIPADDGNSNDDNNDDDDGSGDDNDSGQDNGTGQNGNSSFNDQSVSPYSP